MHIEKVGKAKSEVDSCNNLGLRPWAAFACDCIDAFRLSCSLLAFYSSGCGERMPYLNGSLP